VVSKITRLRKIAYPAAAFIFVAAAVLCANAQSKPPVILIPGLTGSELVDGKTGVTVWFKLHHVRANDLRLPISPNIAANHDDLKPGDIIRDIKPGILPRIDVYRSFITSIETQGGYKEGRWDTPPARGFENTLYVFAYDWRRDNVENARLLIRKIDALKRKLHRPDLKFDIIGHSMGGLIARYAAMYGDADLKATGAPVATWAGAKDISRLIILGTPNEGSALSLRDMINGISLLGIEVPVPFIRNMSKFDVFTVPAAYELLPAPGTVKAFDEELKPIDIDLYDPATWTKFGWNVIDDKDFSKEFSEAEQKRARAYFAAMLDRAKRFQLSLNGAAKGNSPVKIDMIGSECKDTLDAMVLYQKKDGKWDTLFKADSFESTSGRKITTDELKAKIYGPGDGVVTRRSFTAETLSHADGVDSLLAPASTTWVCEGHSKLPSNADVQAKILTILSGSK
jgi:pimeloyl-ACP methyl ester carboxylesterase